MHSTSLRTLSSHSDHLGPYDGEDMGIVIYIYNNTFTTQDSYIHKNSIYQYTMITTRTIMLYTVK